MIEYEKFNKVIKGLECCIYEMKCSSKCPYKVDTSNCRSNMEADALALLKAQQQEPRVMTMEEALHAPFAWTETRDGYMSIRRIRGIRNEPTNMIVEGFSITMAIVPKAKYGRFVRCWTSRHDEKRRTETLWES